MHEGGGSSWWRYTMSSELRESERVRERERERERVQQRMPPWPTVWKGDSGA